MSPLLLTTGLQYIPAARLIWSLPITNHIFLKKHFLEICCSCPPITNHIFLFLICQFCDFIRHAFIIDQDHVNRNQFFLAKNCLHTNQHKYLGSERYMAISSLVVAFPSLAHILQSSSITPLQYPPRYFTSDDDDDDDDTYIAAIFHTYSPISTQIFHIWHFTNLER